MEIGVEYLEVVLLIIIGGINQDGVVGIQIQVERNVVKIKVGEIDGYVLMMLIQERTNLKKENAK